MQNVLREEHCETPTNQQGLATSDSICECAVTDSHSVVTPVTAVAAASDGEQPLCIPIPRSNPVCLGLQMIVILAVGFAAVVVCCCCCSRRSATAEADSIAGNVAADVQSVLPDIMMRMSQRAEEHQEADDQAHTIFMDFAGQRMYYLSKYTRNLSWINQAPECVLKDRL